MDRPKTRRARGRGAGAVAAASVLCLLVVATPLDAAAPRRSLLLITLDTFRGDHLGANGGEVSTPHLDRLAAAGANFRRARASVPLTLPSHASILTGRRPDGHGLRLNGSGALAPENETLAEALAALGYETAAFVGSFVLDRRFGLGQGFDHYDDRMGGDPAMLESVEAERDGADVVQAFEEWLAGRAAERPLFAWLHLYDPHAPYRPPPPFRARFERDLYAGEIAYTDHLVGRAVAAFAARRRPAESVVAVIADHGEGLGEHGETTHALLIYNSTLHVPMLLYAPGLVPAVEVEELVRSIDLAPTLLDYLGAGAGLGDGVSLRPWIERPAEEQPPSALEAIGESLYAERQLGWSSLYALETGRHRYLRAPSPELFDVVADPGETRNRIDAEPQVAQRLAKRLERQIGSVPPQQVEEPPARVDAETAARLRSLGYLAGGSSSLPEWAAAVDPKEKILVWERLQRAIALDGAGEHETAGRELEALLGAERDVPLLYELLGASYVRRERFAAAERVYQAALARGFDSSAMRAELALLLSSRRAWAEAEDQLQRALELDPLSVVAHYRLGELLRETGRPEAAAAALEAALEINPRYVYAWNALGRVRAAQGGDEAALEAFRRAVAAAPGEPRGRLNLAVQLERMGRLAEAKAAYEACLADADRPEVQAQAERGLERLRRRPTGGPRQ